MFLNLNDWINLMLKFQIKIKNTLKKRKWIFSVQMTNKYIIEAKNKILSFIFCKWVHPSMTNIQITNIITTSRMASIRWYKRISFCLRTNSQGNQHILRNIIERIQPNQRKDSCLKDNWNWAKSPFKLIPAI